MFIIWRGSGLLIKMLKYLRDYSKLCDSNVHFNCVTETFTTNVHLNCVTETFTCEIVRQYF